MMKTDYKISRMTRNDDGTIVAAVDIFEGEYQQVPDWNRPSSDKMITVYKRTKKLQSLKVSDVTDRLVERRMKLELLKDPTRLPITAQLL